MDQEENIEAVWKRLDRPLWVVTAGDSRERGGLIATWITQSSLDPAIPTVTAGIAPNHFTCELIDRVGSFGLHLLRVDQTEFIERFADGSGRERDKLTGLALREPTHTEGAEPPILKDCLAWLDCRVTARLDGGDRVFFWADVVDGQCENEAEPLRESQVGALDLRVLQRLDADRTRDIQAQAPMAQQWRENLPAEMRPKH